MRPFIWDSIANDLQELRAPVTDWITETTEQEWPLFTLWPDGVAEFRDDRDHVGLFVWAETAEEAHAKLLKHEVYLQNNETEV